MRVARDAPGHLAVDGVVLDLRKRGLVPMGGDLQTAGVIHHMKVAARVDTGGPGFEWIRAEQPTVAFEASPGGRVVAVFATDGAPGSDSALDCPPIFDGLIAAHGRLFV